MYKVTSVKYDRKEFNFNNQQEERVPPVLFITL